MKQWENTGYSDFYVAIKELLHCSYEWTLENRILEVIVEVKVIQANVGNIYAFSSAQFKNTP